MNKISISIMDIVNLANSIRKDIYDQQELPERSPVLLGLASGLDVGLTLLDQSAGPFDGLTQDAADKIRAHFLNEATEHRSSDLETSIWYLSYAKALEQLFRQRGCSTSEKE